ncbi:uncharacterized protein LOC111631879 [Centruroides sculpturatus]|uniref:uncharacterized protein LOC111631879 n=1 Tax=Centruroides sculpturatus TaxID=218467 RepID=UPI000C6D5704|nr:uncharacterized protein LOC111631879 [Centruroides sculpturatus]
MNIPKPLGKEIRERVIANRAEGKSIKDIAECLRISTRSVPRIIKRHQETDSVSPGRSSGRPRITTSSQNEQLRAASQVCPFATASSHRSAMGLGMSIETVKRRLREDNLFGRKAAQKKNLTIGNQMDTVYADGCPLLVCWELVRIDGHLTAVLHHTIDILEQVLLPTVRAVYGKERFFFVHDSSPVHTASIVTRWLQEHPQVRP